MEKIHLKSRILNPEENLALLRDCAVGRIGTVNGDGTANITPVNYAFEPQTNSIYIHHSNKGGNLLDNLKRDNRVCFEIEQAGDVVNTEPEKHICNADQVYRSVICYGRMETAGSDEKVLGLRLLGSKFTGKPVASTGELEQHKLDKLVVLVFRLESVSGKCREPLTNVKLKD